MKKEIFYSIQNGGDGSAYPMFMESMELAELDQEHIIEGWGEPCTGSITMESDSEITVTKDVNTAEDVKKKLENEMKWDKSQNLKDHLAEVIELIANKKKVLT